jgi:predicted nucleic acid-binding protein
VILVDAGPLVAILSGADQHHRRCTAALRRIREPMGTVWPAVTEAMHLLKPRPAAQRALLRKLADGELTILRLDRADLPRVGELMEKYADLPMDLADAALVRVAERDRLDTVFTVDREDFAVYRIHGRRKFTILPG